MLFSSDDPIDKATLAELTKTFEGLLPTGRPGIRSARSDRLGRRHRGVRRRARHRGRRHRHRRSREGHPQGGRRRPPRGRHRAGHRTGGNPGGPRRGVRWRRPAVAARHRRRGRPVAADHLPQPVPLDRPPGRRRTRRPGRGGRGNAHPGRLRRAVGRVHGRHPVRPGVRRRHGLRPAADLALSRRTQGLRQQVRRDDHRPARHRGARARQLHDRLRRAAHAAALGHPDHPRPGSGLRRRRTRRSLLRAPASPRLPRPLRPLDLLAAHTPGGPATTRRGPLAVASHRRPGRRPAPHLRGRDSRPASGALDRCDPDPDRVCRSRTSSWRSPRRSPAPSDLAESFPAGSADPAVILTRGDAQAVAKTAEGVDGRDVRRCHGHQRRPCSGRRHPRSRAGNSGGRGLDRGPAVRAVVVRRHLGRRDGG